MLGKVILTDLKMRHFHAVMLKYWFLEMCAAAFRQVNTWLLELYQAINSQFHEYIL